MRILLLFSSLFLMFLFVPKVSAQYTDTQSKILQTVNEDLTVLNDWVDLTANAASSEDIDLSFYNEIPSVISHLNESLDYYSSISNDNSLDEATKLEIGNIISAERTISASLYSLKSAIESEDGSSIDTAFIKYDEGVDKLNSAVSKLPISNGGIGGEYSLLMLLSTIVSGFISVGLFIFSRGQTILPSDQLKKEVWFTLFKSSLWPSIGSFISFVWYEITPPGGTFYILWGPVLFGYFYFFKGIFTYFSELRPQIASLRNEELAKLKVALEK